MKDVRVVFMGTPEFACPVLKMLIENTNVVCVVTKEDKLVGRKKVLTPSPVAIVADEAGIDVLKPRKLKEEYEAVLNYKPDLIVTCAYGQIVPKLVLDYPEYGCVNVHASLLPKYRGASPISAAIMDGEEETGITIMYMDEGLDTGNIINSKSIKIEDDDTLGTLSDKLSVLGSELLKTTLPKIIDQTCFNIKQDDEASNYVGLLKRSDERLDFNKTRKQLYNYIRALNPAPMANILVNGVEWKVVESKIGNEGRYEIGVVTNVYKDSFGIGCADGEILITKVKPAGKNIMDVKSLFNGIDKSSLLGINVGEKYEEK